MRPWNPGANGDIRALHADSDGNLFVGGLYTSIAGTARSRLAKLDAGTGNLVGDFNPNVNGDVWALERIGARLFLGGAFGRVGGQRTTAWPPWTTPWAPPWPAGTAPRTLGSKR